MYFKVEIWVIFVVGLNGDIGVDSEDSPGELSCDSDGWLHVCDNGACIKQKRVCDGVPDCKDGSDERPYENVTSVEGYACTRRNDKSNCFLPKEYVCDVFSHCMDDECNCSDGAFICPSGQCINLNYFCDEENDCESGGDEIIYRSREDGIKCYREYTGSKACGLTKRHKCDGIKDCTQGGDECFCGSGEGDDGNDTTLFDETCFRCLDGLGEMLSTHLCNGFITCSDLSDECLCQDPIPICKQLAYEENCEFRCRESNATYNGTNCIKKTQICDGKRDCFYGEDEKHCHGVYTVKTEILQDWYKDMPEFWCCNAGYPADCLDEETYTNETYTACDQFYQCKNDPNFYKRLEYGLQCDGDPTCTGSYDECANCSHGTHFCDEEYKYGFRCPNSTNPDPIVHNKMCDGVPNCNQTFPLDSYDEINCPGRFYCFAEIGGEKHVSIDNALVCDCIEDCINGLDEAHCTNHSRFCCLNKKEAVRKDQVCNGIDDCTDGSDECQSCIESPFADDENLISNKALRAFVWIIGICSSLGNLYVFAVTFVTIYRGGQQDYSKITAFHVAALSLADFCVGLYLLCLGIVSAMHSGNYCNEDKAWRSGNTCNFLGVLSMFGTQASVFILTLMTLNRLYIIYKPFNKPDLTKPLILIIFFFLLGLIIALVPVIHTFEDFFTSHVRLRRNPFLQRDINRRNFSNFANKLRSYSTDLHNFSEILGRKESLYPWRNLFDVMLSLNDTFEPEFQFGYYSSHGVCLPKLFPVRSDPSWQYSMFLIVINFTSFFVIFISYIALYRKALQTRMNAGKRNEHRDQSSKIQGKITRIIATDFFCWMPICVIAFLKISGTPVSDEVYAIAAIVILPINSAINPFLYSSLPETIWNKIEKTFHLTKQDCETVTTSTELQRISTRRNTPKLQSLKQLPR